MDGIAGSIKDLQDQAAFYYTAQGRCDLAHSPPSSPQ